MPFNPACTLPLVLDDGGHPADGDQPPKIALEPYAPFHTSTNERPWMTRGSLHQSQASILFACSWALSSCSPYSSSTPYASLLARFGNHTPSLQSLYIMFYLNEFPKKSFALLERAKTAFLGLRKRFQAVNIIGYDCDAGCGRIAPCGEGDFHVRAAGLSWG